MSIYDPIHDVMKAEPDTTRETTDSETPSEDPQHLSLDKSPKGGRRRKTHNVLSSARSRHLKKEDGHPFWRKDIQYAFLKALFDCDVKAFTDPFPDSEDHVTMDDRALDPLGRLSFAELYIKTIAHSSKCSKVLKDRLLNDMKMSIPTCMICLLVNVGRMNTTINFVPDMKSQLRTYHPIPSLQVNYDSSTTGNDKSNDKQLQDTPRLKSILKACCDDTGEFTTLEQLQLINALPLTTCVNMIFVMCNDEDKVQRSYFSDTSYSFFDIFMNASYDPRSRADLFQWLLWSYLESRRAEEKNPFGVGQPTLRPAVMEFDIDTPLEKEFGEKLLEQRTKYLADDTTDKKETREKEKPHREEITPSVEPISGPVIPALRQDIDVERVRANLKALRRNEHRKRQKTGLLKLENYGITKEGLVEEDQGPRLRLKNYKGDYGEYSTRFTRLFEVAKQKFREQQRETKVVVKQQYEPGSLKLREFSIEN